MSLILWVCWLVKTNKLSVIEPITQSVRKIIHDVCFMKGFFKRSLCLKIYKESFLYSLKNFFGLGLVNEMKFCDFTSLLLKSAKHDASINGYIHSCIMLVIYMWNIIIKISLLLICKNNPEWQKVVKGQKTQKWTKFEISSWTDLATLSCNILRINSGKFYTTFWIPEWLLFQWILVLIF